jgi:hypothetical protein
MSPKALNFEHNFPDQSDQYHVPAGFLCVHASVDMEDAGSKAASPTTCSSCELFAAMSTSNCLCKAILEGDSWQQAWGVSLHRGRIQAVMLMCVEK